MKRPDVVDTENALQPRRWLAFMDVNAGDRAFRALGAAFAAGATVVIAAIAIQMTRASSESLSRFGLGFLTSGAWDPVHDRYGAVPFVFGTVVSSLVALIITIPIALGVAMFLSEFAPPWLRGPIGFLVELLAAIPSVVYGLWGVFVLAPFMRSDVDPVLRKLLGWTPFFSGPTNGHDVLTGSVILSIMILPTVASISRDVMRAAPPTLREGALALGATRWEAARHTLLPYVRSGLVGAVLLGLGRALGETMAITMVIGNSDHVHASLFAPAQTMASLIANQYTEASGSLQLSALTEIGLLLLLITLLFNISARLLVWRVGRMPQGARPV
jgi:phosphate transport system permease protein